MHNKDWGDDILDQIIYRGEGNSSIVVALKNQAKVIRLLKKDGKIMKTSQDHHVSQHPMRSLKFIHLIMKPLTDPFLSGATELIHLKSDIVNGLSERVEIHRPMHRLDKTLVLDDQYALVMDDLCTLPTYLTELINVDDLSGPTISIEIKPKQGFPNAHRTVMKSSTNEPTFNSKSRNCCIYGSTQLLKLARGRISKTSGYCPINLFSGCPVRMRAALEELIHNPQNNFRIFKDLILAYGESRPIKLSRVLEGFLECEDGHDQRLVDLLISCLLNQHVDRPSEQVDENSFNNGDVCSRHPAKIKCNRCDNHLPCLEEKQDSVHELPKSCVLLSVLRAQKLDTIGPHRAQQMLEWLLKCDTSGVDILEELSKPQMPEGFASLHRLPHETKQEFYFRKVWEFLVSLTAKDCSIIITLRRISAGRYDSIVNKTPCLKQNIIRRKGDFFVFNVGIADLDQKMPLKIHRICENLNWSD